MPDAIEKKLARKSVFVTGATGLIGKAVCKRLEEAGAKVVALIRDIAKARSVLPQGVELVCGDMAQAITYEGVVDYVIHAASPTASRAFVETPVEVMETIVQGASNVLTFAREKSVAGVVLLSTMEVYGLTDSEDVTEGTNTAPDTMAPRNCYPIAKRFAECLFASASKEYGVAAKIARLTQTFGRGIAMDDQRVFAQFARAAQDGRNIVLKSDGTTARCYCAIDDAVDAILTILVKGENGKAYNVANPDTYCTIREMAEFVAKEFSQGRSKVVIDKMGADAMGYLPPFRMKLNVDRLVALGWRPTKGLKAMFSDVMRGLPKA